MPADRELVDIEPLLVGYLTGDADLDAAVSTKLPESFVPGRRVRLFRVGGADVDVDSGYVERAHIGTHCFGETEEEAFDVARKALRAFRRAAIAPAGSFSGAEVTRCERALGPVRSPDPETNTPRYLLDVILTIHPTAG